MIQLSNVYAMLLIISIFFSIMMSIIGLINNLRGYVTPAQLEQAKAEILEIVEKKYPTKEIFSELKEDVGEMKETLSKIYDMLIKDGQNA